MLKKDIDSSGGRGSSGVSGRSRSSGRGLKKNLTSIRKKANRKHIGIRLDTELHSRGVQWASKKGITFTEAVERGLEKLGI